MTLSFKDFTKYSGILSVSLVTLALHAQPTGFYLFGYIASLRSLGTAGTVAAFVLAVAYAFAIVSTAWLVRTVDNLYLDYKLIPFLSILFIAFGLMFLAKHEGPDPFPSVHPFWQYASLAYGFLLINCAVNADEPKASAKADLAPADEE